MTITAKTEDPEVVLNLWYLAVEESGFIYALSGRCYSLRGNDTEKLSVLKSLAATDYHTAIQMPVPKNFKVVTDRGTKNGIAHVSELRTSGNRLFDELIDVLQEQLPVRTKTENGELVEYQMTIPKNPLSVQTCLLEKASGEIIPVTK